jgi:hypothetical protein
MKMRTVLVLNVMFLSLVANAAESKKVVTDLDRIIEARILAARESFRVLDTQYKLYIKADPSLISNYADKVVKSVADARYYVDALQKGKDSNAKDKRELSKHIRELNTLEAKAHSYKRCSEISEASKSKNDAELLAHLEQHIKSDKKDKKEQRFADRCASIVNANADLFLKSLNAKANGDVLKKNKALKADLETKAIEAQKAAIKAN